VDLSVVARIHDDPDAAPYIFRQHFTQIETPADREDAIRRELMDSREEIGLRLGKEVRQFCFPWGVRGRVAAGLLADCGYTSAVVDRQGGIRLLRPGQPPFRIARLPSVYIRCLPGKGRKRIWRIRTEG
jgi:hypothetical protein